MIEQHIQDLTDAINRLTAVCEKSLALSTEALTLTTENNALAREAITLSLHAASGLNTVKAPRTTRGKKADVVIASTDVAELLAHEAEAMGAKTPTDPEGKTEVIPVEAATPDQMSTVLEEHAVAETPAAETPAAETPADPVVTVEDLKTYVNDAMEKTDNDGKKAITAKLFELNKELNVERVSFCPAEKCAEYLTAMKRWF